MTYKIPSSFSTICTSNCSQELVGFLLSLSLHHPNAKTFVICDCKTKEKIDNMTPKPLLDIYWKVTLDKYTQYNRDQMVKMKIWDDFQMEKASVISYALENENDTLFLDSDTIILDTLYIETNNENNQIGVSPQFIQKKNVDETGYYNGGMLWTNQKSLPEDWRRFTKTSRYHDQASIEDLVKIYPYFEFGDNYNLQTWRFLLGVESTEKIRSYVKCKNNKLYYKDKPLKFIHTHFNSQRFQQINNFFIKKMMEAKLYRELAIIYRVINDSWIIQLPKQPMTGIWRHKNDSFRELAILMKLKNNDVEIELNNKSGHCWLKPNILMYDRPTLEWLNNEIIYASNVLLGNGDINVEGKQLSKYNVSVNPWIFWPRRPMILEKVLKDHGLLDWEQRITNTIFIGNFENSIQKKYRQTNFDWETVLDEYHCTAGQTHKFTQQEYLMKLRSAKYGLCLRGYGSKCHREVELMAFGTVPIVTKHVSIDSYYDTPIENKHYIRVNSPEDLKNKISLISKEEWETMSNACYEWYKRNIHSNNCWKNMMYNILYK